MESVVPTITPAETPWCALSDTVYTKTVTLVVTDAGVIVVPIYIDLTTGTWPADRTRYPVAFLSSTEQLCAHTFAPPSGPCALPQFHLHLYLHLDTWIQPETKRSFVTTVWGMGWPPPTQAIDRTKVFFFVPLAFDPVLKDTPKDHQCWTDDGMVYERKWIEEPVSLLGA